MSALMIQGTASGVGKSLLTAGLCRLLARSGVRVAPFKPQNMSNNAAVCPGGGEIGRAQALQAFAAGLEPSVDMNPVLIKPEGDRRAQLVVGGRATGVLQAERFRESRAPLLPLALAAFERLRKAHDFVLVEGAGSPAEPNLRRGDLANMGFAEAADIPVWLVGDIDRGGVFAALLGTLAVLDAPDRRRVEALVVNGFRGAREALGDGVAWLARRAERPVLGVVPRLPDLRLPDEDAPYGQLETQGRDVRTADAGRIRVGVVHTPTASNLTDLDALSLEPGLEVVLVRHPQQLWGFDLVVLPGAKAVVRDLAWLRETGFVPALEQHLRYGGRALGICGGLQMLGASIDDPHGVEGGHSAKGLGWLPLHTSLQPEKALRLVAGRARWPEALPFEGYEIHAGRGGGRPEWYPFHEVSDDRRVFGTYVHGLFDRADYRRAVFRTWFGTRTEGEDLERRWRRDLDLLADTLSRELDLSLLESRLGRALS
ncbi:MAG: cobyric acid synthase [Proteobacteria bacterium]|nr:cobyric acid synthase [Pseudomonadota bacterium]